LGIQIKKKKKLKRGYVIELVEDDEEEEFINMNEMRRRDDPLKLYHQPPSTTIKKNEREEEEEEEIKSKFFYYSTLFKYPHTTTSNKLPSHCNPPPLGQYPISSSSHSSSHSSNHSSNQNQIQDEFLPTINQNQLLFHKKQRKFCTICLSQYPSLSRCVWCGVYVCSNSLHCFETHKEVSCIGKRIS